MIETDATREKPPRTEVIRAVADRRRRLVLGALADRDEAVDASDVAARVVAAEDGVDPAAVAPDDVQSALVSLVHVHVPKLARASLVHWDRDARTVRWADESALDDPRARELLAVTADDWDAVLDCLTDERRRTILAVLAANDDPMTRDQLASAVASREDHDAEVDDVRATLHHVHLPKLRATALVSVDDGRVAYEGHPDLDPAWFGYEPDGRPLGGLLATAKASDV